jgi:hypothetical protein
VQSITLTMDNIKKYEDKNASMLNLAMLLEVKTGKNDTNQLDYLKQIAKKFNNLLASKANVTNNGTTMTGERMFSSIIHSTNDTLTREQSINNNFAYFNLTKCKAALVRFYNLTDTMDIMFITNNFNETLNQQGVNSYTISAYNAVTKEKLNIDLCQNITETIEIPISNITGLNITKYNILKQSGVDIFNPNDPIYNDRCLSFVDNSTSKSDTTVNWRKANLLSKQIPQCVGINCEYHGITADNNLNCTCGIKTDIEILNTSVNIVLDYFSKLNIEIIMCPNAIFVYIFIILAVYRFQSCYLPQYNMLCSSWHRNLSIYHQQNKKFRYL